MSFLDPYVVSFVLCCLIVAAAVEGIKRVVWIKLGKERPVQLRHIWRLCALCTGALSGLGIPDLGWYEGFAVGCGAGMLSTSTVAVVQRFLESKAPKESS